MPTEISLREVTDADIEAFFVQQLDVDANRMAAFTSENLGDRSAFDERWGRIRVSDTMIKRTITLGGEVVGSIVRFHRFGKPEITYWIAKEHWGKGIATQALCGFLELVPDRPLYARAARDNLGSLRVLQKCGFQIVGHERAFANARGKEIEEVILELNTPEV